MRRLLKIAGVGAVAVLSTGCLQAIVLFAIVAMEAREEGRPGPPDPPLLRSRVTLGTPAPALLSPPKFRSKPKLVLGVVRAPADGSDRVVGLDWNAPGLVPSHLGLGYSFPLEAEHTLREAYGEYLESIGYHRVGSKHYSYAGSSCDDMSCAYDALAVIGEEALAPVVETFEAHAHRHRLNRRQRTVLVTSFVQSLKYRVPEKEAFGILPPPLVIQTGTGDCDSRALLAVLLLRGLGIDAVILSSDSERHAALGVGLEPAEGWTYFTTRQGRKWVFVETTDKFEIGVMPRSLERTRDWTVVTVRSPAG